MADYIANPKAYGDVEHYGWTTEEEEDYDPKGKEETSSDEEDDPLPNLATCMWGTRSQATFFAGQQVGIMQKDNET